MPKDVIKTYVGHFPWKKLSSVLIIGAILKFCSASNSPSEAAIHDPVLSRTLHYSRCYVYCLREYGAPLKSKTGIYEMHNSNLCLTSECHMCRNFCKLTEDECSSTCTSEDCQNVCDWKYSNRSILNQTMLEVSVLEPDIVCTNASNGNATIFLKWDFRVKDKYTRSVTGHQIVFVLQYRNKHNDNETDWTLLGMTTNSFVSIHQLKTRTLYMFRVVAISDHWESLAESSWLMTASDSLSTSQVQNLHIDTKILHRGAVSVLLEWTPPTERPCFYKVVVLPTCKKNSWNNIENELQAPPTPKFWINQLKFDCNYSVSLYSYASPDFSVGSQPATIFFQTSDCLTATNHSFLLCEPSAPVNLTFGQITAYSEDNYTFGNVTLYWQPPEHTSTDNRILNYTLEWVKEIPLYLGPHEDPHKGKVILPPNVTSFTINGLEWLRLYRIQIYATSVAGQGEAAVIEMHLGEPSEEIITKVPTEISLSVKIGIAFGVLTVVLVVAVILLRRKHLHELHVGSFKKKIELKESNPIYEVNALEQSSDPLLANDEYEINFSQLTIFEVLGEGAFGKVVKAELKTYKKNGQDGPKTIVAVKMLKDYPDLNEKRSLLLEIEAMKQIGHHPNIVSIIGCCTVGPNICLVMDHCPLGDLRQYLLSLRPKTVFEVTASRVAPIVASVLDNRCESPNVFKSHSKSSSTKMNRSSDSGISAGLTEVEESHIDQTTLLSYARQIALGMEFLAKKKYVHRDLATRNILLSAVNRLKISDFGLTRDVYETNMYQPTSPRKLPYKWMAIESIFDSTFTTQSDVWSYGIVLWEIVTLGGSPYPGIPNEDLFKLLKEGYRMENPGNCSQDIYQIMLSCWHPDPSSRPSFTDMVEKLESMLERTISYVNLTVSLSADYYKSESKGSSTQSSTGTESERETNTPFKIDYIYRDNHEKPMMKAGYEKVYVDGKANNCVNPDEEMCKLCNGCTTAPSIIK